MQLYKHNLTMIKPEIPVTNYKLLSSAIQGCSYLAERRANTNMSFVHILKRHGRGGRSVGLRCEPST
jgi:hypothetical protein